MTWRVPLFDTRFSPEEEEAVLRPLRAAWLTMGEEVQALERELAEASGAPHAIAVCNCTAALELAAAALAIGPGQEVLCPSLTFVASASAFRQRGATVRFCDITGPDDLTLDPQAVEAAITPATRAVVAVHYAGFPCDMERLAAIAKWHELLLIEDCAHACFTRYDGKTLGLHGAVGAFSFYSNKNITCGEGGALLTDNPKTAERLRLLRSHGMTVPTLERHKGHAFTYDVLEPGFNYRLDELRAALLRAQLRKLPAFLEGRRRVFRAYQQRLAGSPIHVPFTGGRFAPHWESTAVHIMPVLLPEGTDRTAVMGRLKEAGIQTSLHYPPVHRFAAYADGRQALARTEQVAARELTLPLYPALREEDIDYVVRKLLAAVGLTYLGR
jgi:dTDP-4-amino-4,6-dideoxygalactose transaminase